MADSSKRKYCDHCGEYVSSRTYRRHVNLFRDHRKGCESSEEDEPHYLPNTDAEQHEGLDLRADESNYERVGAPEQGTEIHGLEEEDLNLLGCAGNSSFGEEIDEPGLYREIPGSEVNHEMWNLSEEDLDFDFQESQDVPSVESDNSPRHLQEHAFIIVRWMLIFLSMWSSYCSVSDNALDILLTFVKALFEALGAIFPVMANIALLVPKSLHLFRKKLGIDKDRFMKYVVCRKCDTLYSFDDCYTVHNHRKITKNCSFVAHPRHRQIFWRTACNEPLLKHVTMKNGTTRLYPHKVFCYNGVTESLQNFIQRPGFVVKCEIWRERNIPAGFLADVMDGKIWNEWQYYEGQPYLASPNNYAFMLNVDWFQPFKHSIYSVGVMYMVLMNLPRAERFKPENVLLVGIIPGPREPKFTINSFLRPLVTELNMLWNHGIQATPHGSTTSQIFHAVLLCVGCDIPAARKVCGFTSHNSRNGCSKCTKSFPGSVSDRIDFSGFTPCPPRTNAQHRQQAQEILNQTSATDKTAKEQQHGTRFTELMLLPYLDCIRFHVIDPMHNLFTGTAKHIMNNIWLNPNQPLITKTQLSQIQSKVDNVKVPSSVGRMPRKIQNSYGGFTADQWKSWTTIFSIFALWDILPTEHLEVWRHFVLACSVLCSTVITESRARIGHSHLLQFCQGIETLCGKDRITPNMHLHMHILDCILDYGPVYSFWLFSFERYNGILGEFSTNQRAVEIQLIRKFNSNQYVKDIPLPTVFKEHFQLILSKLATQNSGTLLQMSTEENVSRHVINCSLLSTGPVRESNEWSLLHPDLYTCCPPYSRGCLDPDDLPFLKEMYKTIFNEVNELTVTRHFDKFSSITFGGELYGSCDSRGERSSFVMARWCGLGGVIDKSGLDLRPGVLKYFIRQNVQVNGQYVTCLLASVHWFQEHPARHALGGTAEVWCRTLFELERSAAFIPVQRIHCKFIPATDIIHNEHVLVACPLSRKLLC